MISDFSLSFFYEAENNLWRIMLGIRSDGVTEWEHLNFDNPTDAGYAYFCWFGFITEGHL